MVIKFAQFFTSKVQPEVRALLNWSEDELVSDTLSDVIRKYVNKVCFRMETKYVDKVCFRMESFANSFLATQVQKPLMSVKLVHHVIALLILFILWRLQRKVKN